MSVAFVVLSLGRIFGVSIETRSGCRRLHYFFLTLIILCKGGLLYKHLQYLVWGLEEIINSRVTNWGFWWALFRPNFVQLYVNLNPLKINPINLIRCESTTCWKNHIINDRCDRTFLIVMEFFSHCCIKSIALNICFYLPDLLRAKTINCHT